MLRGAKVLVTGGAGFIASNLILKLKEEGANIRVSLHDKPLQVSSEGIEIIQSDLRELKGCREIVDGIDVIFHCAANTSGAGVMATRPLVHVTPNVVMNVYLLEAAYEAAVSKFVFISSGAAYPPTGSKPASEEIMLTDDPEDVYYPVGWMKRYMEILCRIYATKIETPMSTLVVRPSNIYGPYDKFDFATSHMTAAIIRRVVERQNPMVIWGTGQDVRDLIYISDFLDGLMLAVKKCKFFDEINICSGTGVTVQHVLETALKVDSFSNADIQYDSNKPATAPMRLLDNSRAKKDLGFESKVGLEMGLSSTIEWYRNNPVID